jgi:hypothetical protein
VVICGLITNTEEKGRGEFIDPSFGASVASLVYLLGKFGQSKVICCLGIDAGHILVRLSYDGRMVLEEGVEVDLGKRRGQHVVVLCRKQVIGATCH